MIIGRKLLLPLVLSVAVGVGFFGLYWEDQTAMELHALDVGQGDAILLRHGRVDILVDGGPDASIIHRLGEVRPFWDRTIELLVLTHPQQDHLRGFLDVLQREEVRFVLLPEIPATTRTFRVFLDLLRERGVSVRAARAGQVIEHGDLSLRLLSPDDVLLARATKNPNAGSVVIRGATSHFSFLLTGDIEGPTETMLVRRMPSLLAADVLKIPHHGSKTSSTPAFLRTVRPALALLSVGQNNRYGHPHEAVLRRYVPERLFRTDEAGTISLVLRRTGHLVLRCSRVCPAHRPQQHPIPR